MDKVTMELSRKELFILDHALRYRIKRVNVLDRELQEENDLLNKVNSGIKKFNR